MPLFLSEEEFHECAHDASLVAEKADSFIKDLHRQLETVKAQADASSITAEQTCALLEQRYISLTSDYSKLQSENAQLKTSTEQRLADLAQIQSEKHQLHIKAIGKDGEIERLSIEASELHKSKRQLLELVEQKDSEISEKNTTINTYLDKIVHLTDAAALKQAYLHDKEAELARAHAACTRLSQEKELFERHNAWLNEELTAKVASLVELRRKHTELEADMSSKLADAEKEVSESSRSLMWSKERVKELELELTSVQEELCSSKDLAATNEERFSGEISTVTKLVELYKESSEEWSRKAGDLEGVIKALETHLSQVESDYNEKLDREGSTRKQLENEAAELKEKLQKCEAEIEKNRKLDDWSLLPISSFAEDTWTPGNEANRVNEVVPSIPKGVSGTALAASLLRDGWSLAKMYEKYQEAVDALRHERLGRKQSEAILQRVLFEIEEKADIILDERAEHERMMEAYSVMNQKLQQSLSEQVNLESTIREFKADSRRREREYELAQKEIVDLQKQVTVLLKECRDIQLRCGSANMHSDEVTTTDIEMNDGSDTEKIISERLLTFRDINGLVEQNVRLRTLVRSLSDQNAIREAELREGFELELQMKSDEAAVKVAAVLQRAEEQGHMIESLHASVAMYKRLYEEKLKLNGSYSQSSEAVPDIGRKDLTLLLEGSQDAFKKANDQAIQRVKNLEEELDKSRSEVTSLRSERDKLAMEANFAKDRFDRFTKEFEHQRDEVNRVLSRNVEFSQMIVDYQRKVRESSDALHAVEETSRKLNVEVSLLKHEKELLVNSEKRACDEVHRLSERVHRLQASLDTIQSTDEVREEARSMEKIKREDYLQKVEREWAQAKKELQEERDNVRSLTLDREHTMKNAMRQVEEMGQKLSDALCAVAEAESRAAVAEARCSDLEEKLKNTQDKVFSVEGSHDHSTSSTNEVAADLLKAKEEIEKLKEEAQANKDHMLQYKSIAEVNESAMRQIESAYEKFKAEVDKSKKSWEDENLSLRGRILELENDSILKSKELASVVAEKEEALDSALAEITRLKEENSTKMSQIMGMEMQISSLKDDLEKEHERWRTAQDNYERQVILQSETIQELTKTSQALAVLQEEASVLRTSVDTQESENDRLKAKMEAEESMLEQAKNEAEKKYNEINEQNKILHNRLEALHIKLVEKERDSAGTSLGNAGPDAEGHGDLQTVVNYLRRSKEIAETEISLLRQEKLRLQSQVESALKASETAQSLLHAERCKSRELVFSDEEFRSLQIQVREINLLRESNSQLREENKYNFEECQKLREVMQKAKAETESLGSRLKEKQIEVDSYQKEIEMQNMEKGNMQNHIDELLRTCKNLDLENYDRIKNDFPKMQLKLRETEAELEETRKIVTEKQNAISNLEQDIASTQSELAERDKRINDSLQVETTVKLDVEKQRKLVAHFKKKFEKVTKEKEELSKEKFSLSRQLEDSKQGKRTSGDSSNEQIMKEKEKEKDTRIQILEKMLEREREDLRKEKEENRKEKARRQKTEKIVMDLARTVNEEKKKLLDEFERHKQGSDNLTEGGVSIAQAASETGLQNQTTVYLQAVESLEEMVNSVVSDGLGACTPPVTSSNVDTSPAATIVPLVPAHASTSQPSVGTTTGPSRTKMADEKEKSSVPPKPNVEGRKLGRRLVRPRLERPGEPSGDIEMSEVEGSSNAEGKFTHVTDRESEIDLTLPVQSSARKRLASSSGPEVSEESHVQPETSSIAPLSKKSRGSDSPQVNAEGQSAVPSENLEPPSSRDVSFHADGEQPHGATELTMAAEKDEVHTTGEQAEDWKGSPVDGISQVETQNELNDASEETFLDNKREIEEIADEKDGETQDVQKAEAEFGIEQEEGELLPDVTEEHDGSDKMITSPEPGEVQPELVTVPDLPISGEEGAVVSAVTDVVEAQSAAILINEKNNMGDGVEELPAEDLDKSNNNDQEVVQTEQSPTVAYGAAGSSSPVTPADPTVSKQGSSIIASEAEESKEVVPAEGSTSLTERVKEKAEHRQEESKEEVVPAERSTTMNLRRQEESKEVAPAERSTTINLTERARERAEQRHAAQAASLSRTSLNRRGGSRARGRGRGLRGRGGRGQASDEGQG